MAPLRAPCVLLLLLASFARRAAADCFGTQPLVFHDIKTGDVLEMQTMPWNRFEFVIMPHGNATKPFTPIRGFFNMNCQASVKLPGHDANLTMTLWVMGSVDNKYSELGFEWTDPTGTVAPASQPVNFWLLNKWPPGTPPFGGLAATLVKRQRERAAKASTPQPRLRSREQRRLQRGDAPCIWTPVWKGLVVNDLHDGDAKLLRVTNPGDALTIVPHGNAQHWKVGPVKFDNNEDCVASINFNVPGKPSPPPVPLAAKVWGMTSIAGAPALPDKSVLVWSDPSGTVAPRTTPLNVWTPSNKAK